MTILFLSHDLKAVAKRLEKESSWVAIVDSVGDMSVPKNWKGRVILSSDIEKLMFKDIGGDEELRRKMADWVKAWPNKQIQDKKSLKQLLEYQGTSLWWLGESIFFKSTFGNYTSFMDTIPRLEALKHLVEKNSIDEIHIFGNDSLTINCGKVLCQSLNIKCVSYGAGDIKKAPSTLYPELVYRLKRGRGLVRGMVAKANKNKYAGSSARVLSMSYFMSIREDVYIQKEEQKKQTRLPGDTLLYPVLKETQERLGEPRCMYIDRRYLFKLDSIRNLKEPAFPMDLYYSLFDRELGRQKNHIKKIWKQLRNSKEFHDSLVFNDINKDNMAFMFIKQLPEAVECINTMGRMLDSEKPKCLLISDETGFYGRSLMIAASARNIKTVGLQHGNMALLEIEHYHQGEGKELSCSIPDMSTVGGNNDLQILLNSGLYSEDNTIITGRPRYDNIARIQYFYNRDAVRKRYGVGDRKLVLLTTARVSNLSEREDWLKAMVKASKMLEDVSFLVKPHPGEDIEMHQKIIKKFGGKNIKLVERESDTKELLFASDMTINVGSTVGLESILMGVPFMLMNLTGREIIVPYVEYGATISVTKEEDIIPGIRKTLAGEFPPDLLENMDKFKADFAYKIDGKASERVVDEIQKLIEK